MGTLRRIALLALALLLGGCDRIEARYEAHEGVDLYRRGDFAAAAARFERATRLEPSLAAIQLGSGTVNLALFRSAGAKTEAAALAASRAIASYEEYLKQRPDDERVQAALVQMFVEAGRYDDAVEFFRPRVERGDVEAIGVLAAIASKCNRPAEAEAWHWKRVELAPDRADAHLALGVFLWQELHDSDDWPYATKRAKGDLALAALGKAIELQPGSATAYNYAHLVHRDLAAVEPTEAGRRRALEESDRYLKLALDRQRRAG